MTDNGTGSVLSTNWATGLHSSEEEDGSHHWRRKVFAIFFIGWLMSVLSIFVDESGEFGTNSEYYLLTLVFHDQRQTISSQVKRLDSLLKIAGLPNEKPIHTAPLIRKEEYYFHMDISDRQQLFDKLFTFTRTAGIRYKTLVYRKREYPENYLLVNKISRDLTLFLRDNLDYFQAFESIITYYDGGQSEITRIIGVVFGANLFEVDFRKVKPAKLSFVSSSGSPLLHGIVDDKG